MNKREFVKKLNDLIKESKIDKITGYRSEYIAKELWGFILIIYDLERGKLEKGKE